jgi:hypothetical protein
VTEDVVAEVKIEVRKPAGCDRSGKSTGLRGLYSTILGPGIADDLRRVGAEGTAAELEAENEPIAGPCGGGDRKQARKREAREAMDAPESASVYPRKRRCGYRDLG